MKFPHFKPKFRVLEDRRGDGTTLFYPQRRRHGIWRKIGNGRGDIVVGSKIEQANNYIENEYRSIMAEKTIETKVHSFNLVFHKLKK